jgi:hypothetical protein
MSEDLRTGRRRVDLTVALHLDGDDVAVDTGAVVVAVEEALSGLSVFAGPRRSAFVVDSVDEPLHVNSVAFGQREALDAVE